MDFRNDEANQNKRGDVERAGDGENGGEAVAVVAEPAGDLAEDDAAHGAAKTDEAREGADSVAGD